jgi:putative multiple sugar transport system permease protein
MQLVKNAGYDKLNARHNEGSKNGENRAKGGLGREILTLAKTNIRDYMMYIALIVIMAFFAINTDGAFLEARNITNLINQAGYVAVMAIGMTIILIICHAFSEKCVWVWIHGMR